MKKPRAASSGQSTANTLSDAETGNTAGTNQRDTYFVAQTPYEGAPIVACYVDTYDLHVPDNRKTPETLGKARTTLENPDVVVKGTTNPGYVAFVNSAVTGNTSASPMVVIVDPTGEPTAAVASLGQRRDFKDLSGHEVLWPPEQTKGTAEEDE